MSTTEAQHATARQPVSRDRAASWKAANRERVREYNEHYRKIHPKATKGRKPVQLRKKGELEDACWETFPTAAAAAKANGLKPGNLSKVLSEKNGLLSTGGFEARYKPEEDAPIAAGEPTRPWKEVRAELGYDNASKGPSAKRALHSTVDGVVGKACCTCKVWRPLSKYYYRVSSWDEHRNDCVECIAAYRNVPDNKKRHAEYVKERKRKREGESVS